MTKRLHSEADRHETLWYKDAIIYELHVRAFADSNGDGIGDFQGLTAKLDYLQDLGITAVWLLPFYPSPLKDDGYDIADYTSVHPAYGTMRDFKAFLQEAHRRGIRVITELVLNHTSSEHPWFQRARRAKPGSVHRNFYVWSDTADKYQEARIIFQDFEHSNWTWDAQVEAYYWHRFYRHQPDLNFDSPQVRKAIFKVLDFWLRLGVDGLRLDAVPYLYEREGTHGENLPETHDFLKELRSYIDERYDDRMLLAEANQWPEDARSYFGEGDECHMAFHFPLMPRMFMAIHSEDRLPIIDILAQTPDIPETAQWALFLRNHDELTLEMVTEEERGYMYRVFAHDPEARINLGIRRRLAPLLNNNRRLIELMNGLLFSLPGTPVLYYGDEIGMGDNVYLGDRNGVRTPMQWSADRNAGFSPANPQQLYLPLIVDHEYHHAAIHVEAQQKNRSSLLHWMKRLVSMRKQHRAFGRGELTFLQPANRKVLAFIRRFEDEQLLVVANLSRFTQHVELDLSDFDGLSPVEMFGRTIFPPIGEGPYPLALHPHGFHWFALTPDEGAAVPLKKSAADASLPTLHVQKSWKELLKAPGKGILEEALPLYLQEQRWFGGKTRTILSVEIMDAITVPKNLAIIALLEVRYSHGDQENYLLPLGCVPEREAEWVKRTQPQAVIAGVMSANQDKPEVLYEATYDSSFTEALLSTLVHNRRLKGRMGTASAMLTSAAKRSRQVNEDVEASVVQAEQNNSSIQYGQQSVLKLFRKVEAGTHPELEIGVYLTNKGFKATPPVTGMVEYHQEQGEPVALAVMHQFVANHGDAWEHSLAALNAYFGRVEKVPSGTVAPRAAPLLDLIKEELPQEVEDLMGDYLATAKQLGRRTAELHLALAAEATDPNFAPEPFTPFTQRSRYQAMRSMAVHVFQVLRSQQHGLPAPLQALTEQVLALEPKVFACLQTLRGRRVEVLRIRCHGDYHLGQLLATNDGWSIIDFEGESNRPLYERRLKRCGLTDVASMLRSLHYASATAAHIKANASKAKEAYEETLLSLEPWAQGWGQWASASFLKAYLESAAQAPFIPPTDKELRELLDVFVLERAVYELDYELNKRPDWIRIPLQAIQQLLEPQQ